MTAVLRLEEVSKSYGAKVAVDRVSFSVPTGEIFGLLGPNGAGKTSIIRMVTTITRPDRGRIWWGHEPLGEQHPPRIGYLPEERGLYRKMEVGEHLVYLARLKGMPKAAARQAAGQWLERFGLSDRWAQRIEELSKGLQQQVQFIATVLHQPRLVILDEPFSGLDPVNTSRLKAAIAQLRHDGVSIVLSTHRMEQVEAICGHLVLINQGKNVLEGSLAEVRGRYQTPSYRVGVVGEWPEALSQRYHCQPLGQGQVRATLPTGAAANDLLADLMRHGLEVQLFQQETPSLNDIFIRLVGPQPQPEPAT